MAANCIVPMAVGVSMLALSTLHGCRPPEPSDHPEAQAQGASGNQPGPEPSASEPRQLEGACDVFVGDAAHESPSVEWERKIVLRTPGGLNAIWSEAAIVVVAGSETGAQRELRPTVVSLSQDGREQWRVAPDIAGSSTTPPRAVSHFVSAAREGVYALSTRATLGLPATYLSRLRADGHQLWSLPLEIGLPAALLTDAAANAIVVGMTSSTLRMAKHAADGSELWSRTYEYGAGLPRVALSSRGTIVLTAGLHGTAKLGGPELSHHDTVPVHCAGEAEPCAYQEPGRALLVAEFTAGGEPTWSQLFGTPANVIDVSDLAVLTNGTILVTGEFSGPPMELGSVALCEATPGLPEAAQRVSIEPGAATDPCTCRLDQRDLYLLALTSRGVPLWAKTVGVGHNQPRIGAAPGGDILWAAQLWRESDPGDPPITIWRLDDRGEIQGRFSTPGLAPRALTAIDADSLYLGDNQTLRRLRLTPRL